MNFPWYDSIWLQAYGQARSLVSVRIPHRLAEFEAAFRPLQTAPGFKTKELKNFIKPAVLESFRDTIQRLEPQWIESHEFLSFGREVVQDHPDIAQFQQSQIPLVSELADEPLVPSYNFLSLYNNLGVCEPHLDAPTSKWTLDLCINQNDAWPIHLSDVNPWPLDLELASAPDPELKKDGKKDSKIGEQWQSEILTKYQAQFKAHVMTPGDALFFSGSSQWHFRSRIPRRHTHNFCHLIFLHYVPEHCEALLDPLLWSEYLAMPELQSLHPLFRQCQNDAIETRGNSVLTLLDALDQRTPPAKDA